MDCKKFHIGSKHEKSEPPKEAPACNIINSVSTIEVKAEKKLEPPKLRRVSNKGNRNLIAAFCCICLISALICSAIPMPKAMEDFFIKVCRHITRPVIHETHQTETNIAYIQKTPEICTELLLLPAASDSDAFEAESQDIQETTVPLSDTNMSVISNETAYNVDIAALLSKKYPVEKLEKQKNEGFEAISVFSQASEPAVLIIHTHGTEGYADSAASNYRTNDSTRNVVAVGNVLAEKLSEHGITAIHCQKMFDENSYIKAYSNSYSAVSEYLEKYPSIKYVIDLHRDAIPDSDGSGYARLVSEIDGSDCAQLMLVVGTDEAGAKHPEWRYNLRTAFEIQKNLCQSHPSLMRSVNLRRASFNQQLCHGYFILEAGNCANNIDEVLRSISLFAKGFADTIS